MNAETLERLLIDRELGELSPDVEALLDAYVESRPDNDAVSHVTAETIQVARAALHEDLPKSMPAFPIDGFAQIERWRRRWRRLGQASSLAACILIGLGIGWFLFSTERPAETPQPRVIVVHKASSPSPATPENRTNSMWSVKRWLEQREDRSQIHRTRGSRQLIWESPVERPKLRGEI